MLSPVVRQPWSFQTADQLDKFIPFFFKEMHGHIVEFDVISSLAIGFLGLPGQEVVGLGDGFGLRFIIITVHLISPFRK